MSEMTLSDWVAIGLLVYLGVGYCTIRALFRLAADELSKEPGDE